MEVNFMFNMKKNELAKRVEKLKKEAIKKLKEADVYKGPESTITDDKIMNPEKEKIKTEIKITTKKLKEYLKKNEELSDDLGLDSIFSDEESMSEDIDVNEIDKMLNELEEENSNEETVIEEEVLEKGPGGHERDGSGPHGRGEGPGEGHGCPICEDDEEEDIDDVDISEPEIKEKLNNILVDVQTIKVNLINEEMAEELDSVFSFKEDEDEDENYDDILGELENISKELEDDDLSEDEVMNLKNKIDNLFNDLDTAMEDGGEDLNDILNMQESDSDDLGDILNMEEDEPDQDDEDELSDDLKSLLEVDETDDVDLEDDIII
jgi:hypothetical protein